MKKVKQMMAPSPLQQRRACTGRWTLSLLLVLMSLLGFSPQVHAEDIGKEYPEITDKHNLTPAIDGESHVAFSFVWFNYNGDNSYFDTSRGDVYLYIDGEQVLNLSELVSTQLSGWTCQMFNAKRPGSRWTTANEDNARDVVNDHKGQFLCKGSFTGKRFNTGTIALSNPCKNGSTKAFKVTADICLEEYQNGITHEIAIVGPWVYRTSTLKNYTYTDTPCKVTINAPSFTAPPAPTIKRTGNLKGSFYVNQLLTTYPTHTAKNSSTVSTFYYSAAAWVAAPTDRTPGNDYWGWQKMTGSGSRILWTDIKDGSASKTFPLTLSSNYEPITVYPRMRLWTDPAYEMNPSGAGTIVPQMACYNQDYAAVTLPGYPCPTGLTATPDIWSRKVTLTWTPAVSDTKHYNAYGKWVILRKKTGQPATQVYCGETAVGTYAPGKEVTFVFAPTAEELIPDYDQQYTYIVAFQPDEWGLGSNHISDESEAAGLNNFVRYTISRVNPLKSITATNDREDGIIKVDWTFNSFEDATTTKKYLIHIYRRVKAASGKPANDWEEIYTQEVSSKTTTSGTYNNTGIQNARTVYEYKAEVEALATKFTTPNIAEGKIDGSSRVLSVTASRGAYAGVVRINWTAKQVGAETTYYVVKRRLLGSTSDYQEIYTTSGVATSYSYEDATAQPGCYYQYKVDCYNVEGGVTYPGSGSYTDGFALATGVVSGRVSYGSGTAVEGVKVSLVNTSASDDPQSQFRSMNFADVGVGAGLLWKADADKIKDLFVGKSWMVEVNVFPDASKMNVDGKEYIIWDCYNTATLKLKYRAATNDYTLTAYLEGKNHESFIKDIPANQWSTVALGINAENGHWGVAAVYPDGRVVHGSSFKMANGFSSSKGTGMSIGNCESMNGANSFAGNIDEFRFFTRFLSKEEIEQNYNHRLSGSEDGLAIYYPMDEGLPQQAMVYDYSRTGGISNGRHATVAPNTNSSTNVPSADQFSICAYTDKNGNYSVSGIPFSGDGTSYSIIPTLGIHQFSPSEANRFVSAQSLIHNGVDFTDVSSFPVQGRVVYEGTTYPVADATIYVDGIIAGRDGAAVTTNDEGEFIVDVPIGSHYITVKKNGHTFRFDGRYPADPDGVGTKQVFESSVDDLTFYDTTLVPVAGRVVGGDVEDAYPLGFGLSKANIGQATIVLEAEGNHFMNATDDLVAASEVRAFDTGIIAKGGTATVGAADPADPTAVRTVTVKTDAETGEFAAMLPPLKYNVRSISTASYNFPADNLPVIDATNPLVTSTDSVETAYGDGSSETLYFEYVAAMKKKYKNQPILEIAGNNPDGSFGDAKVAYTDKYTAKVDSVSMYDKTTGTYTFGAPVFTQLKPYTFDLKGYESYVNNDDPAAPVTDLVPLKDVEVTFQNEFAITSGVNPDDNSQVYMPESGGVTLDSLGLGKYTFQVGLPNIIEPYQRNLTVTYNVDGQTYTWKDAPWTKDANDATRGAFNAIVLGQMPSGNNFMTSGPDKVLMILRDPAGTGSTATWAQGTTTTHTEKTAYNFTSENELSTTIHLGVETATAEGIGFMVIQDLESKCNLEVGAEVDIKLNHNNTKTTTTTTTREISTSDGPDFVGSVGDVFVGTATNIIFGDARTVCLTKDGDSYSVGLEDQITMGQEFGTSFSYTQNYIENVLIPTFEEQRNALLLTVDALDESKSNRPVAGSECKYETLLSPDNAKFGQPDTYLMIEPADYATSVYEDRVNWYNMQISAWTRILASNEQAKVTAIKNRSKYLKDNYSFDAGSSFTETVETGKSKEWENEESEEIKLSVGAESGYRFSGVGLSASLKTTDGEEFVQTQGGGTENTTSFSFTLAEDGDDDYLSVDVLNAPDGFGPIFYTRGGATCCPYEDEVVTKYYQPGTVISEKTVQIEMPEIAAVGYASITGVPSGKDAEMTIQLRNLSETGEDGWYNINVVDTTNPDGLQVYMDGYNITNGRTILIPAGGEGVTKKLYFRQSNTAVTDYKDVVLRVSSICQPDNTGIFPAIESMLPVSVTFQPAGSDIELLASETVVNTYTQAPLRLSMRGYDINAKALESVRLQYKGLNDAQWLTLKEYVKDGDPRLDTDHSLGTLIAIEGTNTLDYELDLRNALYTDQTYVFRAQTVCAAAGSYIYGESKTLQVIRDMHRPQLMGNASPSDGVLNPGDEISIVFNEDVRSGELGKAENFSVRGVLNDSQLTHDAALQLTPSGDGAKTTSTIDLAGRSFTLGTWVRYSAAGHIFQHGDAATGLDVSVNAADQLVVSLAGQTLTSTETLRPDAWLYLSVAYDNDAKTVSANYAYDSNSVALLRHKTLSASANGSEAAALTVGCGLTGAMHEVTLWDYAQDWDEALGGIYTSKSKTTRGLIGYWKLDEGHGTLATDYSRSRHMTVPALGAWYIAQANHALTLDGQTVAKLPIAESLKATDDYTLEAWFMADKANGAASIIGFGTDSALDVRLNAAGKMEVACGNAATAVGSRDYRDGQWHHVALNVLRSENGRSTVYVDGEALKQVSGVPALQTAAVLIGGAQQTDGTWGGALNGAIDEVRVWRGTRSAETLKTSMNHRVNPADEPALMMYYPFEETAVNAYQQTVVQPTMADKTAGEGILACIVGQGVATSDATAPSLKAAPRVENIPFTFVADERRIVINLDVEPARLEGSTVEITVHSVSDKNGNYCLPITWTAFVQQNQLAWADDAVELTKKSGEPVSFDAVIVNQSGSAESWTISGLPTWLTASADNGSLQPLGQKIIHFTVDEGVAIGSHEAVIYLTGSMDIDAPLVVSLTNLGNVPEWSVNPADYEYTMNIYGQLHFNGVPAKDKNDIVAAFRGTECVGVAQPVYKSRYDAYFVLMNVYGNAADEGEPLKYKVYDASTGQIFPIVIADDHSADRFVPDAVVGTMANPYIWNATDCIEQNLALKAGWQWISFYVNPRTPNATDIMADVEDDVNIMVSENLSYTPITNTIRKVDPAVMYKLNMQQAAALDVVGTAVKMDETPVNIKSGWNWIGYPANGVVSLNEAFADLDPEDDDMVKSQTGFATWDEYEWVGTLGALQGGEGYQYLSGRDVTRTFYYPAYATSASNRKAPRQNLVSELQIEASALWEGNMNAIALVVRNGQTVENAIITVKDADGNLRSVSEQAVRDGRHFLTIAGENSGDALLFTVTVNGFEYNVPGTLYYAPDAVVGTLKAPFVVDLSSPTGIGNFRIDDASNGHDKYDLCGRRAVNMNGVQVIIADGKKVVVK